MPRRRTRGSILLQFASNVSNVEVGDLLSFLVDVAHSGQARLDKRQKSLFQALASATQNDPFLAQFIRLLGNPRIQIAEILLEFGLVKVEDPSSRYTKVCYRLVDHQSQDAYSLPAQIRVWGHEPINAEFRIADELTAHRRQRVKTMLGGHEGTAE